MKFKVGDRVRIKTGKVYKQHNKCEAFCIGSVGIIVRQSLTDPFDWDIDVDNVGTGRHYFEDELIKLSNKQLEFGFMLE